MEDLTQAVLSNDAAFVAEIADALYALDGVEAVALGGSRAAGVERPDSDWDFGLYYRGDFGPLQVRDLDEIVLALSPDPSDLARSVIEVQQLCRRVRE